MEISGLFFHILGVSMLPYFHTFISSVWVQGFSPTMTSWLLWLGGSVLYKVDNRSLHLL